ncbi:MAG TPA: cell division protein CrgA [Mycobacteriales bacterium]|nr:cell division protein CrgA [Mycobacteriales bacterium]
MPKSRVRKKDNAVYIPPPTAQKAKRKQSPRWLGPLILALWLFGAIYLVVAYMTEYGLPVMEDLQAWNIAVGFGFIAVGFGLATQWH